MGVQCWTSHSAMGPNRLLRLTILLCSFAPWAKAVKDRDVKEEMMMARMVNLVAEVQKQLQQLEQKNIDLSIDMERREKEIEEQVKKLESENALQGSKLAKLEARVSKDSAYLMTCAQRNSWPTIRNATITFDYLTADFNNADSEGGADGQLDIVTGEFTSLTAGIYEVTFSGVSVISPGGDTESSSDQYFYLMHNVRARVTRPNGGAELTRETWVILMTWDRELSYSCCSLGTLSALKLEELTTTDSLTT